MGGRATADRPAKYYNVLRAKPKFFGDHFIESPSISLHDMRVFGLVSEKPIAWILHGEYVHLQGPAHAMKDFD